MPEFSDTTIFPAGKAKTVITWEFKNALQPFALVTSTVTTSPLDNDVEEKVDEGPVWSSLPLTLKV